ncbi:hypothetical protein N0V88_004326 [Collariella sp. IMI 366227]|nr:hypothetical protein N0V88_004326 [Collariella sp. IMI 366227]
MASYTPAETIELMSRVGAKKGRMRPDKIFLSAVSSGCFVSFASGAALITTAAPWLQEHAPGVVRAISGLVFPSGIVMIFPYREQAISNAKSKQVDVQFHQIFLRGIGCNWLVCLACYLGLQAKDLTSKVVGMWWPIFAFVTLGLEHVVANMFFIPIGLFLGTPGLTVPLYIWKGIIPTTLGNILGGAGFCGAFYYWMHLYDQPEILVDGLYYERMEEGTLVHSPSPTVVLEAVEAVENRPNVENVENVEEKRTGSSGDSSGTSTPARPFQR